MNSRFGAPLGILTLPHGTKPQLLSMAPDDPSLYEVDNKN